MNKRGGRGLFLRRHVGLILRELFMGGESFGTSGVAVVIKGAPRLIFAKLHWLLADGDGH